MTPLAKPEKTKGKDGVVEKTRAAEAMPSGLTAGTIQNGKTAAEQLSPEEAEKVRERFTPAPDEKRGPGRPPKPKIEEPPPPAILFKPEQLEFFLDMMGESNAMLAAIVFKVDLATTRQIWCWKPEQKRLILPAFCEVVNRRLPEWLRRYGDLIMLGAIIVPVMQSNLFATIAAKQQRQAARPSAEAEKPKPAPPKPNGSGEVPKPESQEPVA